MDWACDQPVDSQHTMPMLDMFAASRAGRRTLMKEAAWAPLDNIDAYDALHTNIIS